MSDDLEEGSGAAGPLESESEEASLDDVVTDSFIRMKVEQITFGFTLTYRDIRDNPVLKQPPFISMTVSKLQKLIKNGRDKVRRKQRSIGTPALSDGLATIGKRKRQIKDINPFSKGS